MVRQPIDDLIASCTHSLSQSTRQYGCFGGEIDTLQHLLHGGLDRRLLFGGQGRERLSITRFRDVALRKPGDTHKVVCGIVLAEIGTHAVNAAVIHQIGFLEARLARDDILAGHEDGARSAHKAVWKWWRALVSKLGRPGKRRKARDSDNQQDPFENIADRIGYPRRTIRRLCAHLPLLRMVPTFPLPLGDGPSMPTIPRFPRLMN